MRHLALIFFAFLIAGGSSVHAADPNQIFGTILGEINRQIERKQQKQQLDRLRPLWTACSQGDVAACDRAAQFPNLTDQARAQIARMRDVAEQRPAYERNFYACQKMDQAACEAALRYRYASDLDRTNLQNWQRAAIRQQALAGFRQHERNCYAGSVAACDSALTLRQLDETAVSRIQTQRTRLLFAEKQRQLRETQRKAALREYAGFRSSCGAGERAACAKAIAHPQVPYADVAFLKRRERELAPIAERLMSFVADVQSGGNTYGVSMAEVFQALLGLFALGGAVVGIRHLTRHRVAPTPPRADEPSGFNPIPASEPPVQFGGQRFPLTGHMPTDVRRALTGA